MLHGANPKTSRTRLVSAVVVAGALAVSGIALAAPGDVIQTLNVAASPSQLPEEGGRKAELQFIASACFEDTTPDCRGEAPQVPDVERGVFVLDRKDIDINPEAAEECDPTPWTTQVNPTPQQAVAACGKRSVVGNGFGIFNLGQSIATADVTVFNGKEQGGKPTIHFYFWDDSTQQGTAPVGVLKQGNKLDVRFDPLPDNARLATFGVDIKKGAYVRARCSRDRKHSFKGTFSFSDAPDATVDGQRPCQVKK